MGPVFCFSVFYNLSLYVSSDSDVILSFLFLLEYVS